MSNEFDPELKMQLAKRKAERAREQRLIDGRKKLIAYLKQRGISSIKHDPTLTKRDPTKSILPDEY